MEGRSSLDSKSIERLTKSRSLDATPHHSVPLDTLTPLKLSSSDQHSHESKAKSLARSQSLPDQKEEDSSYLRTLAISQSIVLALIFLSALYLHLKIYLLPVSNNIIN
jgi:hypothetical protein